MFATSTLKNSAPVFPSSRTCSINSKFNPAKDLIPIHPAAHYMIGALMPMNLANPASKASTPLARRAAPDCTAPIASAPIHSSKAWPLVHGAGKHAAEAAHSEKIKFPRRWNIAFPPPPATELDITDVKSSLRSIMWRHVGIERAGERLAETLERLAYWGRYVMDKVFDPASSSNGVTAGWELQNMLSVCA